MNNNVKDDKMESALTDSNISDSLEYEQGIFDILTALLELTNLSEESIRDYAKDIASGRTTLQDILEQQSLKVQRIQVLFSEDLIDYPNAVANISKYLVKFAVDLDTSSEDALLEGYKMFAKVFEELLDIFNDDIRKYLLSSGKKIGALISMTYVTFRILYKGNAIRKKISMIKSADFFEKKECSIKRLIYRFRKSKRNLMQYLEGDATAPLEQVLEQIKTIQE